jgi:hypothetical protein
VSWPIGKVQLLLVVRSWEIHLIFLVLSVCVLFCLVTGSHYEAQAGLKFTILLAPSPECWDYRSVPSHLALVLSVCKGNNFDKVGVISFNYFTDVYWGSNEIYNQHEIQMILILCQ